MSERDPAHAGDNGAATAEELQSVDGSWFPRGGKDRHYGAAYTTSLTILALTPPYQVLPIFQR